MQVRRIDPCLGQMGDGPQHALAGKGQGGLHMLRNGQRGVAHQGRQSVHGISGGFCGLGQQWLGGLKLEIGHQGRIHTRPSRHWRRSLKSDR